MIECQADLFPIRAKNCARANWLRWALCLAPARLAIVCLPHYLDKVGHGCGLATMGSKDLLNFLIAFSAMGATIWWDRITVALVGWVLGTVLALAGIAFSVWPRPDITIVDAVDPQSPFPASVSLKNGFLPLRDISIFLQVCEAADTSGRGKIISGDGCKTPYRRGGVTTPQWQGRALATDETWVIPLGANLPFLFNVGTADVRIAIRYRIPVLTDQLLAVRRARINIHPITRQMTWHLVPND